MGLSLWLPPPPQVRKDLQKIVEHAAAANGGPTFTPHITLLTSVPSHLTPEEVAVAIRAVVPPEEPLPISLSKVQSGDTFFQSVLAAVHPSEYLLALNAAVHDALTPDVKSQYFPHLSIYYGEGTKEEKDAIVKSLYDEGFCVQKAEEAVEVCGVHSFDVTEIWVVDTQKRIEEWDVVAKISLIE